MKHSALLIAFCALLLLAVGCEQKQADPVVAGPFAVDGATGIATGEVFGVAFTVDGADGASVKADLSGSDESPSRAAITLADDVKLNLLLIDEGKTVTFELNGKSFGNLQSGDSVDIDKDRGVKVNGESRAPAETPAS